MKHFKTYEAYKLGVNGVGSLRNSLTALKRQNINGRYVDPEILAQAIRNEYEAITGEKYEDEVQMSMDNTIADIIGHYKLDGPDFMAAWDKVVKESVNEAKGGQIMPGDYVKNQHGNIYQRVDGKVGRHDAYVRVTNGKVGKRKTGLHDSFKLTLVNKDGLEESVNEASDQQRLTHLRKFGIAPNNQPQNGAYIKQVSKPGKFFVDWKDAFDLGDVALEFVKSVGSISEFDIIDLKTMKRTGKQLDVKKGQLGNLRTTYGVRVNESLELDEAAKPYKKGQRVNYQLDHKGGVGKFADATSKSKNIESGVIKKRTKGLGGTFKYELTNGLELYGSEIVGLTEAEFKHINKDEHAIKLAIKDVEKKARLKANRNKPLEYEQLSLNKIMLSKVLGREKLGKEHQAAWKKLKKEYSLKESIITEDQDTIGGLNKMANTDLERIADYADMIKDRMSQGQTLDAWMYSKISDSVKNLNSVHDTMDGNDGVTEGTYNSKNHIGSTSDGQGSNAEIYKKGKGYYVVVSGEADYDFDAKNDKELLKKLKDNEFDSTDILELNEAEDYKYKKYVSKAFDKISDAMFEFRNAMGVKQLGQADPKLKKRIEAMQAEIFALRREMKSEGLTESVTESYKGNFTDFKYDLELALDNMGISFKAIKSVKKKGKGYEVRLSSYMSDKSTWEKIGDTIGATLISFKPGSINIGIYE